MRPTPDAERHLPQGRRMRRAARPARKEGRAIWGGRDAPFSRPACREVTLPGHRNRRHSQTRCPARHRSRQTNKRHDKGRDSFAILRRLDVPLVTAPMRRGLSRLSKANFSGHGMMMQKPLTHDAWTSDSLKQEAATVARPGSREDADVAGARPLAPITTRIATEVAESLRSMCPRPTLMPPHTARSTSIGRSRKVAASPPASARTATSPLPAFSTEQG